MFPVGKLFGLIFIVCTCALYLLFGTSFFIMYFSTVLAISSEYVTGGRVCWGRGFFLCARSVFCLGMEPDHTLLFPVWHYSPFPFSTKILLLCVCDRYS